MAKWLSLVFIWISIASFAQAPLMQDLGYKGGSIKGIKKLDKSLNFLVIGDWGRNGENYQKDVANSMGKAAHDIGADFVIATGDNFYPYGVASTQDYHWISSYETIYTAQSLHVKWYVVLGNHDYASNPDAEVAYTNISSRWTMPSRYHSKTMKLDDDSTQALFVFLDTDPIEKELRGAAHDSIKYPAGAVEKQRAWLEKTLSESKARWKIVVGHHPLYTGGWRKDSKDTKNMKAFLEPIFNKYNVDVYIAGHEHHLEYTKPAGKTHYVISGGGSEARPAALNPNGGKFIASEQGYAVFSMARDKILLQFIDHSDKILNESVIAK